MPPRFALFTAIGLLACSACMGAAAGLADASLFENKPRCTVTANATSRVQAWDGTQARALLR